MYVTAQKDWTRMEATAFSDAVLIIPKAKCTKQQFTTYFRYHLTEQDWTDVPSQPFHSIILAALRSSMLH
jgi:hypothetical protein